MIQGLGQHLWTLTLQAWTESCLCRIPTLLVCTTSCKMASKMAQQQKPHHPSLVPKMNAEPKVIINVWIFFPQVGY